MQFSAAFLTFTFIFIVDKIVQGKTEVFSFVIIYQIRGNTFIYTYEKTELNCIYLHII